MKKLAVFDLDGTLLDSLSGIAHACNLVLKEAGLPQHPQEAFKRMVGNGVHMLLRRAIPEKQHDTEIHKQIERRFAEEYHVVSLNERNLFPGVPELLEKLRAQGMLLAVSTNKPDAMSRIILGNTLPQGLLAEIVGQREGVPTKPDPAGVRLIMDNLRISPEEAVYVGDSDVDIFTAKNAGISSVGVSWGFRGRQELEQAGADLVVDTMDELFNALTTME